MTCAQELLRLLWGGARSWSATGLGIGMLYSDISLFIYVQIVVYFLNAAFQFYTSKVI